MKYLFITLTVLLVFLCNNPDQKQTEVLKEDKRKIDPILDAITKKYPNYTENTIVRESATKELDNKIDSILNFGYLNDIPLLKYWQGLL